MEEYMEHFWRIILYFKKGKNVPPPKKKIHAGYGEGTVTNQLCQKWFGKFHGTIDILAK